MALEILTSLAILLIIGIILTFISKKIKVPNIILLIAAGFALKNIRIQGEQLISFSSEFLTAIAIIALIMILFDSTSKFHFKSIFKTTTKALLFASLFIIITLTSIATVFHYVMGANWLFSFLFSSIIVGTDAGASLFLLKDLKHKVITFLQVESIINTPFTVILPFMVLQIGKTIQETGLLTNFFQQIVPFLQQIITGIGAGVVISLIVFKVLQKEYMEALSPITLLSSSLLTYILAEALGGNGVLAVTTLGLFFGNFYFKKKKTLKTFGKVFSNLFEMLLFLLLGLSIKLPTNVNFYLLIFIIFVIYIIVRFIITFLVFQKSKDIKEIIFISCNASKGIAVAVVVFTLLATGLQARVVYDASILFIIYSIPLATIINRFPHFFLGIKDKR